MSRKLFAVAALAISTVLVPGISSALDSTTQTTVTDSATEIPKDSWLSSMTPMLPDLICKGFMQDADLKKRFDEIKMNYEQCAALIPESTAKCQNELYAKIPATINGDSAGVWGRALGECIGRDFAEKHLVPKS